MDKQTGLSTKIETGQIMTVSQAAVIQFPEYAEMRNEVIALMENMKQVTVTEETIKANKALLSEVRKQFKIIDKERISVKNKVLEPYQDLDAKVKDLKNLLDEGEQHIKEQVDAFTEKQRQERKEHVAKLFEDYRNEFSAPTWLSFDNFIMNQRSLVTNSSTSEVKIKRTIISFFESWESDYNHLKEVCPNKTDRSAVLTGYRANGFDMEKAIIDYTDIIKERDRLQKLQDEHERQEEVTFSFVSEEPQSVSEELSETDNTSDDKEEERVVCTFEFEDQDQYTKAIEILKEHGVGYEQL